MAKRVRATDAKNNFGGLLEDVAAEGRVEIVRHGRLVAIVLSPKELELFTRRTTGRNQLESTHMIPKALARAARIVREPRDFDDGYE
ncbi:MAG TPA: type II toxin-antitoxin system prevent-host-death family antitoxin [Polyangiaceae bacterium]|nr:type II toxin-antitoxin system prevent-host-death family antitoxin [Polyangiaceae bacterium]